MWVRFSDFGPVETPCWRGGAAGLPEISAMAVEPYAPALAPDTSELPAFPVHRRSGWTLTTHYYGATILWSFVLILLLLGWYAVEKYVFALKGTPMRMVADPTEFGVRIVG